MHRGEKVYFSLSVADEGLEFLEEIQGKYRYSKQQIIRSAIRTARKEYKRLGEYVYQSEEE